MVIFVLSLFHYSGFILVTFLIFLVKVSKKSFMIFGIWASMILIYSAHYRSPFTIVTKEIQIFDTYRYLVNSIPLFIAGIFHGEVRPIFNSWYTKGLIYSCGIVSLIYSLNSINTYMEEEEYNYHSPSLLVLNDYNNHTVLDVYPLISMLDFYGSNSIGVRLLDSVTLKSNKNREVLVLNRFDSKPIADWINKRDTLVKLNAPYLYLLRPKK